jgi:hypothetical protein
VHSISERRLKIAPITAYVRLPDVPRARVEPRALDVLPEPDVPQALVELPARDVLRVLDVPQALVGLRGLVGPSAQDDSPPGAVLSAPAEPPEQVGSAEKAFAPA